MSKQQITALFMAIVAMFATACASPDDHPPMADGAGGLVPTGSSGVMSSNRLVISMSGNAPTKAVTLPRGSVKADLVPLTFCADGGDLTVANLELAIIANDGGALFLDDGQPVFTEVAVGNDTDDLLGPGNYTASALHADASTTFPAVTVFAPGPMKIAAGHCEDLSLRLNVAVAAGPKVKNHSYSLVFCAACAGVASVEAIGVYPVNFTVTP